MSDSSTRTNPSMLEPSNMMSPCSAFRNCDDGISTFLITPRMSVNCSRRKRACCASASSRISLAVTPVRSEGTRDRLGAGTGTRAGVNCRIVAVASRPRPSVQCAARQPARIPRRQRSSILFASHDYSNRRRIHGPTPWRRVLRRLWCGPLRRRQVLPPLRHAIRTGSAHRVPAAVGHQAFIACPAAVGYRRGGTWWRSWQSSPAAKRAGRLTQAAACNQLAPDR